jgi:hypothetical protein
MPAQPPLLLIAFNRTDTLGEVLRALEPVAPPRVYVAADGPREDREGEAERCRAVREMLVNLPWRCEIHARFLDRNAGCAVGVSSAVSWFLEQEESGIVLEDDCVPDPSFFPFCAEVLERHARDERVMSVLGTRFAPMRPGQRASYSYSRLFSPWGWATWRRAWRRYELELGDWRSRLPVPGMPLPAHGTPSNTGWGRKFDTVVDGRAEGKPPHTWDYQWIYAHMLHDGLAVIPRTNLITNVGEGPTSTHLQRGSVWLNLPRTPVAGPLAHPDRMEVDEWADGQRERWQLNHRPWIGRKYWQLRNQLELGSVASRRGW